MHLSTCLTMRRCWHWSSAEDTEIPNNTTWIFRRIVKDPLIALIMLCTSVQVAAFEVFALGTSNTNCKNANQAYTSKLNNLLEPDQITVINGGSDGDRPVWMKHRLETSLSAHPNIRMVIFEPGPNERNKDYHLKPSAEILKWLQEKGIPTIYVSHNVIQTEVEALAFAKSFGATYYGHWTKNVPADHEHRQYDWPPGTAGHMTAKGCELWAEQMAPLIRKVAREQGLLN